MERLGNDIFRFLPASCDRKALQRSYQVQRVWREALGDALSKELRPGMVDGGCLHIFTSSSAWLTEARFLESRILRALEKAAPGLGILQTKIRLDTEGSRDGVAPPPLPQEPLRPLTAAEAERIEGLVRDVQDPALKGRLARLFEKATVRGIPHREEADGEDSGD